MVKVFSKYAGRAIILTVRDSESKEGYKEIEGFLTSFKDDDFKIYEINILNHDNTMERGIKVEDILLIQFDETKTKLHITKR